MINSEKWRKIFYFRARVRRVISYRKYILWETMYIAMAEVIPRVSQRRVYSDKRRVEEGTKAEGRQAWLRVSSEGRGGCEEENPWKT